ncbi:uncharacterized protein LJ206_008239 isoform 4-T11 [Theristicus caerulescens]
MGPLCWWPETSVPSGGNWCFTEKPEELLREKCFQMGDNLTLKVFTAQIPDVLLQQQIQQGQDVFIFLQSKSCKSSVMEVLVFCGQPARTHQQL